MKESVTQQFICSSYKLLEKYQKRGRYYHSLSPKDNSPVVVHKETNQLTYVVSGSGRVILNGKEEQIDKDKMIFVEAGTMHQFFATSEELVLFHVHIPDEGRDSDRYIVEGEDYKRFE